MTCALVYLTQAAVLVYSIVKLFASLHHGYMCKKRQEGEGGCKVTFLFFCMHGTFLNR